MKTAVWGLAAQALVRNRAMMIAHRKATPTDTVNAAVETTDLAVQTVSHHLVPEHPRKNAQTVLLQNGPPMRLISILPRTKQSTRLCIVAALLQAAEIRSFGIKANLTLILQIMESLHINAH